MLMGDKVAFNKQWLTFLFCTPSSLNTALQVKEKENLLLLLKELANIFHRHIRRARELVCS